MVEFFRFLWKKLKNERTWKTKLLKLFKKSLNWVFQNFLCSVCVSTVFCFVCSIYFWFFGRIYQAVSCDLWHVVVYRDKNFIVLLTVFHFLFARPFASVRSNWQVLDFDPLLLFLFEKRFVIRKEKWKNFTVIIALSKCFIYLLSLLL